jgi:hypothetical protein
MDGSGSIQVNNCYNKFLEYRFIIKLDNSNSNYNMLIKIAKVIGGNAKIINNNEKVI